MRTLSTLTLVASAVLAGCASGPPFIDQAQPEAVAIAQRRAAFEFNCPNTTAQVLSRETLQPLTPMVYSASAAAASAPPMS